MLVLRSWEKRYLYEKENNLLTNIKNEVFIDRRTVKTTEDSIYSDKLGGIMHTDRDSNKDTIREYSCECGALSWKFVEGEICEKCGTVVKKKYMAETRRMGWVDLSPYFIIQPGAYELIAKVVGSKNLINILKCDVSINIEGLLDMKKKNPREKYNGIGMIEFRKRFAEILTFYANIKKNVSDRELQFLIDNQDKIFSRFIPITHTYLRPTYLSTNSKMISYNKINSYYQKIVSISKTIKKNNSSTVLNLENLLAIQMVLQEMYLYVIKKMLSGKEKLIRSKILGSRLMFSGRFVIRSLTGEYAGLDHIVLNYKGFIELYILEILAAMRRGYGNPAFKNMTVYELYEYIQRAKYSNKVDEAIYSIIEEMIKRRGDTLRVLINRNPTFDLGSIQCMKIVHVTKDANDTTMAIPLTSLASLNADFDGDVLNVYCIKEKSLIKAFEEGFSPRNLIIDKTGDSYFNQDFGLIKDMLTNLFTFMADDSEILL